MKYKAFYIRKEIELEAETSYDAQKKAATLFKVPEKKSYLISVMLCEKDGKPVIHAPNF
jgi:chorismate-pyruvate lyase